ncbi:response regulator [Oceanispirochaeta sp.]|uniref:response regulator n=1 Tax=Oceanispirochaeta sp. TaxID=2035350 RepID=UPI002601640B|nr:response regulator [Oceanispirochaeta sp.]MDA3958163.1 response regulator [Oceanispirochaeta sp.]
MDKKRLLIVDDTLPNLQLLGNILKDLYSLSFASGGQEALDMLEKSNPDMILLDIMMPSIDGFEVCRRIRKNPVTKSIPIIFLSAKNDKESVVKGMSLGAQDYLVKPFSSEDVLSRIRNQFQIIPSDQVLSTGREDSKSSWVFINNRIDNLAVCHASYKSDLANQIQSIESELDPLVSVIPGLLNYIHDLEELMGSGSILKLKDIQDKLNEAQKNRLNPDVTAAVHTLHDNLQDLQYKLIDIITEITPQEEAYDKKEQLSLKALFDDLKNLIPDEITIQWLIKGDINLPNRYKSLKQALLSLLDNALDAIQEDFEHHTCSIRISILENHLIISILDSGPGISEKVIKQIFKFGFSSKPGRQGSGLTAAHLLIKEHFKGKIDAVSGTKGTMIINIPMI